MRYKLHFLLINFFLVFLSLAAFAQHLPFQGKLLENGQPVNGTKTFLFSITSPGINWSETHPNVPVNNGLYAVVLGSITNLPTNLFAAQTALNLSISVNGVPLDIVPIYPPIESDPTVISSLKDGVSWNEILSKPPNILNDTSPSNELQNLSLNNQTLSITMGNSVELPQAELPPQITFNQPDTLKIMCPSQLSMNPPNQEVNEVWQSFTACYDGFIQSIFVQFSNLYQTNLRLTIYPGEGISGQEIFNHVFPGNQFTGLLQLQEFALTAPLATVKGNIYTFKISGISNPISVSSATGNPYIKGVSSFGNEKDLKFEIQNQVNTPFTMHIQGILTGDNWGVVPSRGIIMWSGSIADVPEGWALCDGNNGTPDLRDRFIVGAGTSYSVSSIGGEATHTLTINEMPLHGHPFTLCGASGGGNDLNGGMLADQPSASSIKAAYTGAASTTEGTQIGGSGGGIAHNTLPPYYSLAFIMKL